MERTLWELAQSFEHKMTKGFCDDDCPKCSLREWARETAKEWEAGKGFGKSCFLTLDDCIADLGVPEEKP